MRWIRAAALVGAFAAAGGMARETFAGKPGGTTPPPAGTIYFRASDGANTSSLRAMSGDGSGKTFLRSIGTSTQKVHASRMLHGGNRWFLTLLKVADEPAPGGQGIGRYEVFALRDDDTPPVRLTNDPTLDYLPGVLPSWDWCPDESSDGVTIAGIARRWTGTSSAVIEGSPGVYTAHLSFDASGGLVGLDAQPTFRVSLGTVLNTSGTELPDGTHISWSPDMSRLVCDRSIAASPRAYLRVIDVATGAATVIYPTNPGWEVWAPTWSPDGSKIAYQSSNDGGLSTIETVTPDGAASRVVATASSKLRSLGSPWFSPDSEWLVFGAQAAVRAGWQADIFRVGASGGTVVNLTADLSESAGPLDWR